MTSRTYFYEQQWRRDEAYPEPIEDNPIAYGWEVWPVGDKWVLRSPDKKDYKVCDSEALAWCWLPDDYQDWTPG